MAKDMDHQDLNDCGGFMMEVAGLFEQWAEYENTEELTPMDKENQQAVLKELNESLDYLPTSIISNAMSSLESIKETIGYGG
jgi:hypothetical protein